MVTGAPTRSRATDFACAIRRTVLIEAKRAHVGHIGSALSVADILAVLYADSVRAAAPDDPDRDRVILAKGHAALALYAAIALRGWLPMARLSEYCADGGLLGTHPEQALPGVDLSTGSLGQGLPVGTGAALAARLQGSDRRVFVVLSDAECNEGSVWESIMFAAHHRLSSLIAIVDDNGQQALGHTAQVLSLSPLRERWAAFGWDVHEVDGHDHAAMAALIASLDVRSGPPHAIIARTTFGKGIPFMEGRIKWHYWPMSDEEFASAMHAVDTGGCEPPSSPR